MDSKAFGNSEDDLPMSDRKTDVFGNVHRGQQGPLLMTRWASASLLAGEGNKHFMFTVGAANSSKTFMQIATLEIGCHRLLDDRFPVAVLGLVPIVVNLLKRVKMPVDQTPQVGGLRIAWAVEQV